MKGEKAMRLLGIIGAMVKGLAADAELLRTVFYNASYKHGPLSNETIHRMRLKLARQSIFHRPMSKIENKKELQRIRMMVLRLKRQGLVKQEVIGETIRWFLTERGKERKGALQKRWLPNVRRYKKYKSTQTVLVIFDIPEKERHKRVWVRLALVALGFSKLQKSVWMGNVQLPKEFIRDMEQLNIGSYIHIFSVHNQGTLQSHIHQSVDV